MSVFREALRAAQPAPAARRWVYVPYDQLARIGPLAGEGPLGAVIVEDPSKAARRPYHQQKLALVLANGRQFALELARSGVAVDFRVARQGLAAELAAAAEEHGPLTVMEPAERELRDQLAPLGDRLRVVPHAGWLTTAAEFDALFPDAPYRMDKFYRAVRQRTGILMEGGKPLGGKYSHDAENRKAWTGSPPAPPPPRFAPDAITREVGDLVRERYGDHPGRLDLTGIPTTAADAEAVWAHALSVLPSFGPYEDAMTSRSRTLFHTGISGLMNTHRLLPERVVREAVGAGAPLASTEGFVRQVLGWREFVRHVHRRRDGYRDGPNVFDARRPLPPAYWGKPSGLNCLDEVVRSVWEDGYSHHITRLMILSNLAVLLDSDPRELTDWFWVAYVDAYDWVVEPNVLGMGTFADGDRMVTKPYVAGSAYIDRMSDYCAGCRFDPKKTCPITTLYWAFLARAERVVADNHRMRPALLGLGRRDRAGDAARFEEVRAVLDRGEELLAISD